MVFFVCDACGQSLKKNQVEKHVRFCKKCQFLSCLDCNKEFWGDDYKAHTKCITEDEKYGGKNYKPKTNSNKGENKQNDWLELVREIISNSNIKPHLVHVIQELVQQPNLPRKRAKFENFLQNSMRHCNPEILEEAWEIFSKAQEKMQSIKGANKKLEVDVTEAKENYDAIRYENGSVREKASAEIERSELQSEEGKGKSKKIKIEKKSYEEKKEIPNDKIWKSLKKLPDEMNKIDSTFNSSMEVKTKCKKSHRKEEKSKRHSDDHGKNEAVSEIQESFQEPNFSTDIKKKNKKRKHDAEDSEVKANESLVVASTESSEVPLFPEAFNKKRKKHKRDKESDFIAIGTSDVMDSIEVTDSSAVLKKKKKKRKHYEEASETKAIETPVPDVTESIEVSETPVVMKKKSNKHKHDKEREGSASETSKHLKLEIPKQGIFEVKDDLIDVEIPKKKKKKSVK